MNERYIGSGDFFWQCDCEHPESIHVRERGCIAHLGGERYKACSCSQEPTFLCDEPSYEQKPCILMLIHDNAHTDGNGLSWKSDLSKPEYIRIHIEAAYAEIEQWLDDNTS